MLDEEQKYRSDKNSQGSVINDSLMWQLRKVVLAPCTPLTGLRYSTFRSC
jgi:hypothetical protein